MSNEVYISSQPISVISRTGDELLAHCLLDSACLGKRKPTLYINAITGAYICHRCGRKGMIDGKQTKPVEQTEVIAVTNVRLTAEYVKILADTINLPIGREGKEYLRSRGLRDETIKQFSLGYNPDTRQVSIPNLDYLGKPLAIHYRSLYPEGQRYTQESLGGARQQPFNIGGIKPASDKTLFITEGQMDAISLWQLLQESSVKELTDVIGIPGKDSFVKNSKDDSGILDFLATYRKVYLVPDNEVGSRLVFERYKRILGPRRTSLIFLPTGFKDISEWLVRTNASYRDLADLISQSESQVEVPFLGFSKLEKASEKEFLEVSQLGLSTGFGGLDAALSGLRPGELTLLAGSGGAGKSTVATQILHTLLKEGTPSLFGSFEMDIKKEVIPRLKGLSMGKNLFVEKDKHYKETPELKRLAFILPETVDPSIIQIQHAIEGAYFKAKLHREPFVFCLLDNFTRIKLFTGKTVQDKLAASEEAIKDLKNITRKFPNLHLMLLCHTTKLAPGQTLSKDSIRGSGVNAAEANNIILIEPAEQGVNLLIPKIRSLAGRVNDKIYLTYDRQSAILTEVEEY